MLVVPGNCGSDYYYNGLGAGLVTYLRPSWLEEKLRQMLPQYGWSSNKTWNNTPCFKIYRGVRPLKALAAAIGLDAATYGGTRPGACGKVEVVRSGSGTGFVTAADGGIDCGLDCRDLYAPGTTVHLEATAYEGSSFDSWSGNCSGGSVTTVLNADATCTATFAGTCNSEVATYVPNRGYRPAVLRMR